MRLFLLAATYLLRKTKLAFVLALLSHIDPFTFLSRTFMRAFLPRETAKGRPNVGGWGRPMSETFVQDLIQAAEYVLDLHDSISPNSSDLPVEFFVHVASFSYGTASVVPDKIGVIDVSETYLRLLQPTESENVALAAWLIGYHVQRSVSLCCFRLLILAQSTFDLFKYRPKQPLKRNLLLAVALSSGLKLTDIVSRLICDADSFAWDLLSKSAKYSPKALISLLKKTLTVSMKMGLQEIDSPLNLHYALSHRIEILEQKWDTLSPDKKDWYNCLDDLQALSEKLDSHRAFEFRPRYLLA